MRSRHPATCNSQPKEAIMALHMHSQPRRPLSGTVTPFMPLPQEARTSLQELIDILSCAGQKRSALSNSEKRT